MTLGNKLQVLRKQKGLSQEQLAGQLNVSRQAVSKWELDTTLPETENIIRLSELFGVSTDYLLKDSEEVQLDNNFTVTKESGWDRFIGFMKKYGYYGGYIFSAISLYCFLGYCYTYYIIQKALTPPVGFETVGSTSYQSIYDIMFYYIILSFIGIVAGIIIAKILEKKTEKYRDKIKE